MVKYFDKNRKVPGHLWVLNDQPFYVDTEEVVAKLGDPNVTKHSRYTVFEFQPTSGMLHMVF
jgi:hypothetical protein